MKWKEWNVDDLVDAAGLLSDYCDNNPCKSCIFKLEHGCMFNSEPETTGFVPWEWDIPERREANDT